MRVALGAVLMLASLASAQSLDIKNARLGMTQAEVRALFPALRDCRPSAKDNLLACGDGSGTYAGAPALVFFLLDNDAVDSISVRVKSTDFDNVVSALIEKFGAPTERSVEFVTNRFGAKFENTTLKWIRGQERMIAERYGGDLENARVILISNKTLERFKQRQKEQTGNRAKDL